MCRSCGTRLIDLNLPGTPVPGYRLFRPCGTAWLQHLPEGLSAARASIRVNKPIDFLVVLIVDWLCVGDLVDSTNARSYSTKHGGCNVRGKNDGGPFWDTHASPAQQRVEMGGI
jgi:hypothetical protein